MKLILYIVTRDDMDLNGHISEEALVVAPSTTIAKRLFLELQKGDPAKKSDIDALRTERIGTTHQFNYPQLIRKYTL